METDERKPLRGVGGPLTVRAMLADPATTSAAGGGPSAALAEPAVAKLATRQLSVSYGAKVALDDITLDFPGHQVTAVIGPSGSGKSTLLRALDRLHDLQPQVKVTGDILLDDRSIYGPDIDPILIRRRIGMVFQRPNPFRKSIFDNVAYGVRYGSDIGQSELRDRVQKALQDAALWDEVKDRLSAPALALSGGQQQRLCVARALAVKPEVLLMDQPTSALDPIATLRIEELMQELVKDLTIVVVTHNMQQAARVSDSVAFLTRDERGAGVLVESGPTTQVFTTPKDPRTEAYVTGRIG
jgi:phosphate transport system ATP-binding protein